MFFLIPDILQATHSLLLPFIRVCLDLFFSLVYQMEWSLFVKTSFLSVTLTWFWKQHIILFRLLERALNQMWRWLGFLEDILFFSPVRCDAWSSTSGREPQASTVIHMLTHSIDLMLPIFVQKASYFRICLLIILLCITQTAWLPLVLSVGG